MGKDVIIACDFPSEAACLDFLSRFKGRKPYVKIGMELFYGAGSSIIRAIKSRGHRIFLDLKLHDIPNTVGRAMSVLSELEVDMINLHAGGGSAMMRAALDALTDRADAAERERPLLIAVTQLTSTSEALMHDELLIPGAIDEVVKAYALNAANAGLDGVVCSPLESPIVHEHCGRHFLTVTPGVRFADARRDDQARITTPQLARRLGSDYIVVGRAVTAAEDPVAAYERCLADFVG